MGTINNNSINHIVSKGSEKPSNEYYTQTYITLDQDELFALGIPRELWDDTEIINDSIHNVIYNLIHEASYTKN